MSHNEHEDEIGVGAILGGTYRIAKLLGRGGMGAVWVAEHLRLPKQVAVKVLYGAAASHPEAFARFRREAEIASRLGHPNIVDVADFNTLDDGTPYLVLELLEGESLAERIERGPMSVEEALAIVRQVAAALHAAHEHSIVHRDLKPDNIFLCPRERDGALHDHVKVLDFGISKIRGSQTIQTQASAVLGTPQYMSPEQASGTNDLVDGRTDQFALAVILCEMLTGEPVFAGNSLVEVIYKVVYEPTPSIRERRPDLPEAVATGIERALSKDPKERFDTISDFVEALSGTPLAAARATQDTVLPLRNPNAVAESLAATVASGDQGASQAAAEARAEREDAQPSVVAPTTPLSKSRRTRWPLVIGGGVVFALVALVGLFVLRDAPTPPTPVSGLRAPTMTAASVGELRAAIDAVLAEGDLPSVPAACGAREAGELEVLLEATNALHAGTAGEARASDATALAALTEAKGTSAEFHYTVARARLHGGDYAAAAASAERAHSACGSFADAFAVHGSALIKAAEFAKALPLLMRAIELEPTHPTARFNLAIAQQGLGDAKQAIGTLDGLLSNHPSFPKAHYLRGTLYLQQGSFDSGVSDLRAAIALDAEDEAARSTLIKALRHLGRDDEAAHVEAAGIDR